jgi:transposase-like protein
MKYRAVSDAEQAEMVRLYRTGLSAEQVGERLGRTHAVVVRALHRTGEPTRPQGHPVDANRMAEATRRYAAGETSTVIAADVGVTPATVLRWVREAGGEVRPRKPPLKVNSSGVPWDQISYQRARYRAVRRLIDENRARFDELLAEERQLTGQG